VAVILTAKFVSPKLRSSEGRTNELLAIRPVRCHARKIDKRTIGSQARWRCERQIRQTNYWRSCGWPPASRQKRKNLQTNYWQPVLDAAVPGPCCKFVKRTKGRPKIQPLQALAGTNTAYRSGSANT